MKLSLMAVFAHPDDESLGMGPTLAKYAAEGVTTTLVTATRGERGWTGPEDQNPGLGALGRIRTAELQAAARALGLSEVAFLDYIDGDLDQAPLAEAIAGIVRQVRRQRPQVVVTFSPDGHYGHPDHIAISQLTAAAVVCAADASYVDADNQVPHRVSKLYYMVDTLPVVERLREILGGISMEVDGVVRHHVGWADWAITTRIDTAAYAATGWTASRCHHSQLPSLGPLADTQPDDPVIAEIYAVGSFYRVFSLVNGGRRREDDLFAGLR